jgi:signal transduction histidine kinase
VEERTQSLRTALARAQELGELKSRFVSMASHEFRTPLSTILSSAYLVAQYTDADGQSKRDKHIQRIVSSVNMLTDILNDFLSVGKIEEGKIQVRPSLIAFPVWMDAVLNELETVTKSGQKIEYQHSGDENVLLDPSLVKHIVQNLVSNAIKFSPENSTITVITNKKYESFSLEVQDQGIGIPEQDQQHLFERFFRGTNAINIQGTGLGLHIVGKYAELMNGTVKLESDIEHGTKISIHFNLENELL